MSLIDEVIFELCVLRSRADARGDIETVLNCIELVNGIVKGNKGALEKGILAI